jgi:hypothetical protein
MLNFLDAQKILFFTKDAHCWATNDVVQDGRINRSQIKQKRELHVSRKLNSIAFILIHIKFQ